MKATTTDSEIGEMAKALVDWHAERIAHLQRLTETNSTAIELQTPGGNCVTVKGDMVPAFLAGIQVAIEVFSPFPLKVNVGVRPVDGEWERDEEATYCILLLVSGHGVTPEAIAAWTDEECMQAEEWAMSLHFNASDNDVEVPPMPACVADHPELR
jgi:hypothetical protein